MIRLTPRHLILAGESHRLGKKHGGLGSGAVLWAERRRGIWREIEGTGSKRRRGLVGGLEAVSSKSLEGAGDGWGEVVIVTVDLAGPALGDLPVPVLDMRVRALDRHLEDRWCIRIDSQRRHFTCSS